MAQISDSMKNNCPLCYKTNCRIFQTESLETTKSNLIKMTKFSKQLENTVENGEIAHNGQFPLFPRCFQKTCTADT